MKQNELGDVRYNMAATALKETINQKPTKDAQYYRITF